MVGRVFDIQRFSIHDGPGIRTTVFLKGCPLHCVWCHNPEGMHYPYMLSFLPNLCIGCGFCLETCPNGAYRMEDGRHILDRARCQVCGACCQGCFSGALEFIGREVTVEEALAEVLRDAPFYETSGGGMTLSGGEPLMQPGFSEALLRAAKEHSLHCCVETCGFAAFSVLERVLPYVDLFLYDIKELDGQRHVAYTGQSNRLILDNLAALHARGVQIILRLPTIPGYNDRPDHFVGVAELMRQMPGILGVEIMPYHSLGTSKLERLGLSAEEREQSQPPEKETVRGWIEQLQGMGVRVLNAAQ
ncbi:MAG: glycyl-radical enzyme activating protein [Anaerolineales bacterium]|nr:glycyl-radical enzyme activating protein [Anaerolineales bacterium]